MIFSIENHSFQIFAVNKSQIMDFTNKIVIITGASTGIGAGAAKYFSQLNSNLVLVARNREKLEEVAKNCSGAEILQIIADVNVEVDRQKIIDETLKKFGKIDVLVNNAGIGKEGNVENFSMDDFDLVMNTNVRSVYHLTQLAIPHLIKSKGNVVNISSVLGIRPMEGRSAYCMSKAAVDHFTRCLALELAPSGVRVNSVNPAVVETQFHRNMGMNEATYQAFLENARKSHALGRVGNVDDIAKSIAFLASNEMSSFITGTILTVDGGKAIMCPR